MDTTTIEKSVQQRAFELFVKRGETHGNDQEDWFKAEKDVRNRESGKTKIVKRSNIKY